MSSSTLVEEIYTCPVCGSNDLAPLTPPLVGIGVEIFEEVRRKLGMSSCQRCRLSFVNPRPSSLLLERFYNREGYDCHNPHFALPWAENDLRARFALLSRHVRDKNLLLDFGTGAGHLLHHALNNGWRSVAGVELGQFSREKLRSEGIRMYVDVEEAHELKGKVDVVTMIQVLEHLSSPQQMLSKIIPLLRRNGLLLIEVPNADSLRARLATSFLRPFWTTNVERYLAFPIHLLYFNARSFRLLLEKSGLRVLSLGTLGMGVEELRSCASAAPAQAPIEVAPGSKAESTKSLKLIRGSVKSLVSALRLGEQLIAVCIKENVN